MKLFNKNIIDVELNESVNAETGEVEQTEIVEENMLTKIKVGLKKAKPFILTAVAAGVVTAIGVKVLSTDLDDDDLEDVDYDDDEEYLDALAYAKALDEEAAAPVEFIEDSENETTNED